MIQARRSQRENRRFAAVELPAAKDLHVDLEKNFRAKNVESIFGPMAEARYKGQSFDEVWRDPTNADDVKDVHDHARWMGITFPAAIEDCVQVAKRRADELMARTEVFERYRGACPKTKVSRRINERRASRQIDLQRIGQNGSHLNVTESARRAIVRGHYPPTSSSRTPRSQPPASARSRGSGRDLKNRLAASFGCTAVEVGLAAVGCEGDPFQPEKCWQCWWRLHHMQRSPHQKDGVIKHEAADVGNEIGRRIMLSIPAEKLLE